MPQYKYTSITQDNQKMTGSLNAENEDAARKELNELGLAILSIEETTTPVTQETTPPPPPPTEAAKPPQEIKVVGATPPADTPTEPAPEPTPESTPEPTPTPETETPSGLIKFEFEARDKTGKKIVGTIPAADKMTALSRLINEYQFDVQYLSNHSATQAEKDHDRQEGLDNLKTQVKDLDPAKTEAKEETLQDKSFKQKQEVLLTKVDYVLEKIKEVLKKFDQEIKPENKKLIQGYIDKLLRIKNSTNLEYIEHTTEELLQKVQDQEIFLHKESFQKEKTSLMLESQELLSSLHTSSSKKSFSDDIQEKLSLVKFKPLQTLMQKIAEKTKQDPEVAGAKSILKSLNKQLFSYAKIWFQTKDKEAKQQVVESMKSNLEERKKIKEQIANLKGKKTKKAVPKQPKPQDETFIAEATNFLGWLLSFYLIYYFATYYFTQKDTPYTLSLPWDPHISETPLLKYLVAILMLWYILLATKTKFAPKVRYLTPALSIFGVIATALIVFNF